MSLTLFHLELIRDWRSKRGSEAPLLWIDRRADRASAVISLLIRR